MSRYIRPRLPGATVFFSVCLAARGDRLLVDEIGHLRAAVSGTRAERPFRIDAMVVLPDHLHAVWTLPEGDSDYSVRWGAIKARFTRSVKAAGRVGYNPTLRGDRSAGFDRSRSASKISKGDGGLWQRRFWEHHIRNQQDFNACVWYCWMNPVKHRFVERPEDWPYSSVHRGRRDKRYGVA